MENKMGLYEQFIHKSRYARYLEEEQRREEWSETVQRYCSFMFSHVEKETGVSVPSNVQKEVYDYIHSMKVMPSMRAMMTAGEALARDNVAGYNPVTGDTKVVTKEFGTLPIAHLEGKPATVLNKDGRWVEAEFRGYGTQPIYKVTAKLNSNTVKEVTCTANHRWIKQDGNVVATTDLTKGDRIDFISAPKPEIDADYNLGIVHGLVYGDGTTAKSCGRVKGYVIRLCGEDNKELLKYFDGYPVTYPPSANGDPVVQMYDAFAATHTLKDLPSPEETDSYLLGFMRGWLAADGSVSKSSQVSLCVADEGLVWLSRNAERLGFTIQRTYKQAAETNYGKRKQGSWVVYFSRSSMVEDDFLCSWKRANFKPLKSHWVVSEVESLDYEDSVYCAEVDDTNTFVLEGGLLTGNCSYLPVDDLRAFDEAMFILLCGTGVGFSVERQYVAQLPEVPTVLRSVDTCVYVHDSKEGWATALRKLIAHLYNGEIPRVDVSKVRPAGARLKTFGGRASGPQPLLDLFDFTINVFSNAVGRKLKSIECHDIMCKIGDVVVVGGVRRSAMISLSNLSDDRMRHAKSGAWWEVNGQRALANNSVAYTETPDVGVFMQEWLALYESKSGERGIFNREAAKTIVEMNGRRDANHDFGTNPCSEIILRPYQFCNLSELVIREDDDRDSLMEKVRVATIIGTLQSTLTHFPYLREVWTRNTEEERLLGVSLTGIMDNPIINDEVLLSDLKKRAVETNAHWAAILGIPVSKAITCVKPSGTVSQLVDSASGIHARFAPYYIRRVRQDVKDPLTQFLIKNGVPHEPCVMKPDTTVVFSFPKKAPVTSVSRDDMSAIEQLETWLKFQLHWCEHKPSVTINVKEDEWPSVGGWVYDHFSWMSGVSFLPHDGGTYKQAPYEEIDEEQYYALASDMPTSIDWTALKEEEDNVEGVQTLACSAGVCEI